MTVKLKLCWALRVAVTLALSVAAGQATADQTTETRRRPRNLVFQPIEDKPGLPRVLLIGDSISMGYTLPVRQMLDGVANVHRPPMNCQSTKEGLKHIDRWLGDGEWDVIHFNWGLHDLKFMGPQGQNLADPTAADSHQKVPIEEYEENLKKLVDRLRQTGATLVWRTTTPVGEGARGRVTGDSVRYNKVAAAIMKEHEIAVDDQYAFALKRLDELQNQRDHLHFTREGSRQLGEQTVIAIKKALAERSE